MELQKLKAESPKQASKLEISRIFWKQSDNKYFWLCGLDSLPGDGSTLLLRGSRRGLSQNLNKWKWLHLAHRLWFPDHWSKCISIWRQSAIRKGQPCLWFQINGGKSAILSPRCSLFACCYIILVLAKNRKWTVLKWSGMFHSAMQVLKS